MQIRINPRDWAHVPVWLWPFVWWQLIRLRAHVRKTGQDGVYQITHDGRVEIYLAPTDQTSTSGCTNSGIAISITGRRCTIQAAKRI
ncbi:MAG: hypothetical protein AAGI14_04525 [Pseudomonadota bacterium]